MESNEAYYIVQKPDVAYREYLEWAKRQGWRRNIERLRRGTPHINPGAYRGISRHPLEAFPIPDLDKMRKEYRGISDVDVNTAARLKMYEFRSKRFEGQPYTEENTDDSALESLEQANEVFHLLDEDQRGKCEIIRTGGDPLFRPSTVGYDLGNRIGSYSIICDCSIMPMWHPPEWEDLSELAKKLETLNPNMLFSRVYEAEEFISYYQSRDWAEKDEFDIIRVDVCTTL